jgi:hypothetical protein
MLNIYLCGAVLAGLLWPIVIVGVIQLLLVHLVATAIQARAAHDGSRPVNAMTLSRAGVDASTGTAAANKPATGPSAAMAETWDRTVQSGNQSHSLPGIGVSPVLGQGRQVLGIRCAPITVE